MPLIPKNAYVQTQKMNQEINQGLLDFYTVQKIQLNCNSILSKIFPF